MFLFEIHCQIFKLLKKIAFCLFFKICFDSENMKKLTSKVAHNQPRPFYFTVQPRPTTNSPELILHIKKSRDQTSVLLSVVISLAPSFSNIVYLSRRSTLIFPFLFYILKLQKILNWFFHGESPLIEVVFWIENVVVYSTWT